jgi:hypothetical protein
MSIEILIYDDKIAVRIALFDMLESDSESVVIGEVVDAPRFALAVS